MSLKTMLKIVMCTGALCIVPASLALTSIPDRISQTVQQATDVQLLDSLTNAQEAFEHQLQDYLRSTDVMLQHAEFVSRRLDEVHSEQSAAQRLHKQLEHMDHTADQRFAALLRNLVDLDLTSRLLLTLGILILVLAIFRPKTRTLDVGSDVLPSAGGGDDYAEYDYFQTDEGRAAMLDLVRAYAAMGQLERALGILDHLESVGSDAVLVQVQQVRLEISDA